MGYEEMEDEDKLALLQCALGDKLVKRAGYVMVGSTKCKLNPGGAS